MLDYTGVERTQGDVILKQIKKLPDGLVETKDKILQHGETTGHRHRFLDNDNVQVYLDPTSAEDKDRITTATRKYVVVGDTAYLRHEEHKPVEVDPGVYEIDIVREFNYDKMEIARVVD